MKGASRDTFCSYKEAVYRGGVESLLAPNLRVPNHKNHADPRVESAVVAYGIEKPA